MHKLHSQEQMQRPRTRAKFRQTASTPNQSRSNSTDTTFRTIARNAGAPHKPITSEKRRNTNKTETKKKTENKKGRKQSPPRFGSLHYYPSSSGRLANRRIRFRDPASEVDAPYTSLSLSLSLSPSPSLHWKWSTESRPATDSEGPRAKQLKGAARIRVPAGPSAVRSRRGGAIGGR